MSFAPEQIEAALFALLKTAVQELPFKTVSRHAKIWTNLAPDAEPAMYLVPLGCRADQASAFGAPRYVFHYVALVYTRADISASVPPQTLLNNALRAIQNVLLTTPRGEKQTLGGLVENAWLDGDVTMQAGILDEQCALEAEIHCLTGL